LTYKDTIGRSTNNVYSINEKEFKVNNCIIPLDWK